MGLLGIRQEQALITSLFKHLDAHAQVHMSSAYLNFPPDFTNVLLDCKAPIQILTSSPEANGFYGAKNVSGYLPDAYTYLEKNLFQKIQKQKRQGDVEIREYHRPGWTFHAKGIWISEPDKGPVWTSIGSSNFNSRSFDRDLEAQSFIKTECPDLLERLEEVCFF